MSITRHPQQSNGARIGYIVLLIAAVIGIASMAYDLLKQQRESSARISANRNSTASTGVSADTKSNDDSSIAPSTARRIQEILGTEVTGEDFPSDNSLADTVDAAANQGSSDFADPIEDFSGHQQDSNSKTFQYSAPVPQETPLHNEMVTPGNFEYVGAFRPPIVRDMASDFSYGGWAPTYRDGGDPNGPDDGFPGSLFIVGHRSQQLVAEITIPRPVISERKSMDDLPPCRVLQPFSDITGGIRKKMTNGSSEPFEIGGMQVMNNRLNWTVYKYYNVSAQDYYSHGMSSVNLKQPDAHGPWHLGPFNTTAPQWHSYKNAGYVFDIPEQISKQYFGGRNLMSGLQIATGLEAASFGPSVYAYKSPLSPPPPGAALDAVPMLWYSKTGQVPGNHYSDKWNGGAWLTVGNKHSVVIVGRKAHGEIYYGLPRPGDCYEDKGYHGSSYEVQALFYTPGQLLEGAKRSVPNSDPWYRWDSKTPGGGLNRYMFQECGKDIGGVAYDRKRNLLYIVEVYAGFTSDDEYCLLPAIHVLRLVAG